MKRPERVLVAAAVWAAACGGRVTVAGSDGGGTDAGPPDVVELGDAVPLPVGEWMMARVSEEQDALLRGLVAAGTFAYPEAKWDENGIGWWAEVPEPGGLLGTHPPGFVWAVARVMGKTGRRLMARTERSLGVYANGRLQPGDVYASHRIRVPVLTAEGENLIAVRFRGGLGEIEAELYETGGEIWLNREDLTLPDLRAGDAGELWVGAPVLNLGEALTGVTARVVASELFESTEVSLPGIAAGAVTQLAFRLRLLAAIGAEVTGPVTVRVRVEAAELASAYEGDVELAVVGAEEVFRRTFRSPDDGSVQYYAVRAPVPFDPAAAAGYAMVLSTHGASVEATGQAGAYSSKSWAWLVAPTNRRPFGFDWEEWGHLNALYSLDDAMGRFTPDPTRMHLTGHSMGGHGAWHLMVMHPGRFATTGPSAAWGSFYSYVGAPRPSGAFARARAHSDTLVYMSNVARRAVYGIHGTADDNVPYAEGLAVWTAAAAFTPDALWHAEEGAGHWWDGDASPGADCVDWPPLFELMEGRTLDPFELDFDYVAPSPAYSGVHSYVTLHSALDPYADLAVSSSTLGGALELVTTNVRSLEIDGRALLEQGRDVVIVDGVAIDVPDGPLFVGPETGKKRETGGPFNQVFHRPWCWVTGGETAEDYVAFLVSYWSVYGNGQACALSIEAVDDAVRAAFNLVYVGLPPEAVGTVDVPFDWDAAAVTVGGTPYAGAGLLFVLPRGDHLDAVVTTTAGAEDLLYAIVPFSSRGGLPDWLVWSEAGVLGAGFFDGDWAWDPALASP